MDTTRDIIYRTFQLNNKDIREEITAGGRIDGSVVDSWDLSDVDVTQFMEKRALQDGMDVGDVYLGSRRLKLAGTIYGSNRALFFDRLDEFSAALSPVLAQREVPLDKGYRPLYFSKPTEDSRYPEGIIELYVNALPRMRQFIIQRDQQGGEDSHGLAVPWQAAFIMRDPVIYGLEPVEVDLSGGGTVSGDFINRGNYIARLNLLVEVGSVAGSISITAGGITVTISVPASTGDRIIRYKGFDKVLTIEENSAEVIRMDKLTLPASGQHPIIPPGASPYVVTFTTVVPQAGSIMWFQESYA